MNILSKRIVAIRQRKLLHINYTGPFGIVSAYRYNLSRSKNKERHGELLKDVAKYRVHPSQGIWGEAKEKSVIIEGIPFNHLKSLAKKYLSTAWNAVKYIANNYYPEKVFMGVGLPYNNFFYEDNEKIKNELLHWGEKLAGINPNIQVCILDYRPEFRSRLIPSFKISKYEEMKGIKRLLEQTGLKCVTAQTRMGYLGPND